MQRIPRVPIAISLHQLGIELGVAPEHACDYLRVGATIHETQTLARERGSHEEGLGARASGSGVYCNAESPRH
jgi:hypothetical protein